MYIAPCIIIESVDSIRRHYLCYIGGYKILSDMLNCIIISQDRNLQGSEANMQVFIHALYFYVLMLSVSRAHPGTVYHIVPSKLQKLNCSRCITLSQFADHPTSYTNSSATTLKITGGNHSLEKEIYMSDLAHFSILSTNDTNSASVITCNNHSKFTFTNISNIRISGLTLIGCVGNRFEHVGQGILEYSKIIGGNNSKSSVMIVESIVNIQYVSFLYNRVRKSECNTKDFRHFKMASSDVYVVGMVGGALIVAHSNLTIDNCLFEGNSANIGGAIFSEAESNITINNSNFTSNTAAGCDRGPCSGGVLFIVDSSIVLIQNCRFQNSTAPDGIGGMGVVFNATLIVLHSYAYNSTSGRYGGVVAAFQSISLKFQFITFNHSKTEEYGGALFLYKSNATVSNSHFVNNAAKFGGVISAWKGPIFIDISNCTFNDNGADSHGGVLNSHTHCNTTITNSTFTVNKAFTTGVLVVDYESFLELTNSNFSNNDVGDDGGVVFINHKSKAVIKSCEFTNNTADDTGGVVSARNSSTIFIDNSLFNACKADMVGGCVFAKFDCNITIVGSTFTNNTSKLGGALALMTRCTIVIKNCKFEGNTANIDGGVLDSRTKTNVSIVNCTFVNNSAVNDGTLLVYDKSAILLENSTFIGSTADHNGGAVYVYDRSNITIKDCNFTNIVARDCGGALYVRKSSFVSITYSQFFNCTTTDSGGVVYAQVDSEIYIDACNFTNGEADYGGAICVDLKSNSKIFNSTFTDNVGKVSGGAVAAFKSSIMEFQTCTFTFNVAIFGGAVSAIQNCNLTFKNSSFVNNKAELGGAFRVIQANPLNVISSTIQHNHADYGGVIHVGGSNIVVNFSSFDHNHVRYAGGCIFVKNESTISINSDKFFNNTAKNDGGIIHSVGNSVTYIKSSNFTGNEARDTGGVINLQQSHANIHDSTFNLSTVGNIGGVIYARNTSFVEVCNCYFANNSVKSKGEIAHSDFKLGGTSTDCAVNSGGVLHLEENSSGNISQSSFIRNRADNCGGVVLISSSSEIKIAGSSFHSNEAKSGAAIAVLQASSILTDFLPCMSLTNKRQTVDYREIRILYNRAEYGGAIYLSDSKLCFESVTSISHNQAISSGGGIYAVHSSIIIGSTVNFNGNQAMLGGGVSLTDSKLYDIASEGKVSKVKFLSNVAHTGGAVYINDETESNVCYNLPYTGIYNDKSGCFFQNITDGFNMNFTNNYANFSGHNLYGGLLDRCAVVADKNLSNSESNGIARLKEISNIINLKTISSKAVRVCLCKSNKPDCNQLTHSIQVKRGNTFTIPVVAIDQVSSVINSTIHSSFKGVYLPENQTVHKVGASCTFLSYQISFPKANQNYELIIYPEGPCNSNGISDVNITIHVLSCLCPPGFMRTANNTECACTCDKWLTSFIKDCDPEAETVIREGGFWITYLKDPNNDSSIPYLIYPHCPLDYCQPPSMPVPIKLNLSNGSDAQCANNRGGLLCGSCQPSYSLSLGSSKCIKCPAHSYILLVVILIAFFFTGILLVAFLFVLNLNVAVGTLNSIIFYANIIDANSSIYFRKSDLTFIPVLVSWLNLDTGFDMCFFNGMDAYTKTWLQLAFPVYMIFLVVAIIFYSSYSSKFSKLLGKKNPVATLATLILLSYTKLLETIILSLSSATVRYPNGTTVIKWLPDASVDYGKGKHIGLIVVGMIVLVFGLLPYTISIFSWQWLIRCRRLKISRNLKLYMFIDTYHTPHTAKHRYWMGILLFVRVIVFLISTFTVSADPRITLLSTIVIVSCLQLYKSAFMIRVYKNCLLNTMESFVLFNIAIFTAVTWYTFDDQCNKKMEILQIAASYISVGAIVILCLLVICFHIYRYGSSRIYSVVQNTKLGKKLKHQTSRIWYPSDPSTSADSYRDSESDVFQLFDIDQENDSGYSPPPVRSRGEATNSSISLAKCEEL